MRRRTFLAKLIGVATCLFTGSLFAKPPKFPLKDGLWDKGYISSPHFDPNVFAKLIAQPLSKAVLK